MRWLERRWSWAAAVGLVLWAIGAECLQADASDSAGRLVVTILNLSHHGLSMLLQTPGGRYYLLDAGGGADGKNIVQPFLEANGIRRLHGLLISHPHGDHQGGVPIILENFQVDTLLLSPVDRIAPPELKDREADLTQKIRKMAAEKGIKVQEIVAGTVLDWDPALKVEVLWPPEKLHLPRKIIRGDYNPHSVVLRVEHGQRVFLFPGDLSGGSAEVLVAQVPEKIRADFLVVPHHGFFGSRKFAEAVQAQVAAAACIVDYADHPTRNVPGIQAVNLFAPVGTGVYVTAWHGTIRAECDGEKIIITTQRTIPQPLSAPKTTRVQKQPVSHALPNPPATAQAP